MVQRSAEHAAFSRVNPPILPVSPLMNIISIFLYKYGPQLADELALLAHKPMRSYEVFRNGCMNPVSVWRSLRFLSPKMQEACARIFTSSLPLCSASLCPALHFSAQERLGPVGHWQRLPTEVVDTPFLVTFQVMSNGAILATHF